jgi:DNA (cytosine-5)-methyltransferase 1
MKKQLLAADLFAGLGGFTQGAEQAGVNVVWCANHWEQAVQTHKANHPDTLHSCQDLRQADFTKLPDVDLILASPCCQGHSDARGTNKPQHDASRATAYAVFEAACAKMPKFIVVENVPEFRNWGTKTKKGIFYQRWVANFEDLGYTIHENILDASEFGVPQERIRLFLTMALNREEPIVIKSPNLPKVAASTIIDWDCAQKWRNPRGLKPKTQQRIAIGRLYNKGPFLIAYFGTAHGGRSLDRPLGTVTTKDRYGLVDGNWFRMLNLGEYRRAMGFPDHYILPSQHKLALHMLGNSVCPAVAKHVVNTIRKIAA